MCFKKQTWRIRNVNIDWSPHIVTKSPICPNGYVVFGKSPVVFGLSLICYFPAVLPCLKNESVYFVPLYL